jgi:hypothetical protein
MSSSAWSGRLLMQEISELRSLVYFYDVHFQELTELHHDNVVALLDCKVCPSNIMIFMLYQANRQMLSDLQ